MDLAFMAETFVQLLEGVPLTLEARLQLGRARRRRWRCSSR